jgi:hypothetical protein
VISVNDEGLDFNALEKETFDFVCKMGRNLIEEFIKQIDNELMEKRDKEIYRHKGLKRTTIKTIMGSVELKRAIYERVNEEGKKAYIYLLDEYLNLETIWKMSSNLVEKMIVNTTECSYRKAAKNVTELTGQSISLGAVWNMVQEVGKRIEEKEFERVDKFKKGMLDGDKEVKIIFEEADGLWLNMQGKDRPKNGKSRKKEIKLAVSYEGWEKRSGKKEAYQVINKKVVSGFMKEEEFKYLRDATLAETYKQDSLFRGSFNSMLSS